jgi:hypothetical protein
MIKLHIYLFIGYDNLAIKLKHLREKTWHASLSQVHLFWNLCLHTIKFTVIYVSSYLPSKWIKLLRVILFNRELVLDGNLWLRKINKGENKLIQNQMTWKIPMPFLLHNIIFP